MWNFIIRQLNSGLEKLAIIPPVLQEVAPMVSESQQLESLFFLDVTSLAIDEKNAILKKDLQSLSQLVTPSPELDGLDMFDYRIEREADTIEDLKKLIADGEYAKPDLCEDDNLKRKEEMLVEIEEHKKDIAHLEKSREDTKFAILRLEKLQATPRKGLSYLSLNEKYSSEDLKLLLNLIQSKLKQNVSREEKCILTTLQQKAEYVKSAIEAGKTFNQIKIVFLKSEVAYIIKTFRDLSFGSSQPSLRTTLSGEKRKHNQGDADNTALDGKRRRL